MRGSTSSETTGTPRATGSAMSSAAARRRRSRSARNGAHEASSTTAPSRRSPGAASLTRVASTTNVAAVTLPTTASISVERVSARDRRRGCSNRWSSSRPHRMAAAGAAGSAAVSGAAG